MLQVTYRQLLDVFFNRVDPTTLNRQGNDRGTQYRSVIYTHDDEQRQQAVEKIAEVNKQLSEVGVGLALDFQAYIQHLAREQALLTRSKLC